MVAFIVSVSRWAFSSYERLMSLIVLTLGAPLVASMSFHSFAAHVVLFGEIVLRFAQGLRVSPVL